MVKQCQRYAFRRIIVHGTSHACILCVLATAVGYVIYYRKKVFRIPTQIFYHKTSWDISLILTGVKMLYESFQQQYYTLQS